MDPSRRARITVAAVVRALDGSAGHFVTNKLHKIKGIKDTYTIIAFRMFGAKDEP